MSGIENLKELRVRYLNGNRRTKDQTLTSLYVVHGCHRKSAIRVMHGELRRLIAQKSKKRRKPGKSRYQDPGFKAALTEASWGVHRVAHTLKTATSTRADTDRAGVRTDVYINLPPPRISERGMRSCGNHALRSWDETNCLAKDIMKAKGIPDFQAPSPIPRFIDTTEASPSPF